MADHILPSEPSHVLIESSRARRPRSLGGRERLSRWGASMLFVAAAAALALLGSSGRPVSWWLVALLVGVYALASRVEFEVGSGSAVPTQIVFVPMLFLLPLTLVPACVAAGFVLGDLPSLARGRVHPERIAALVDSSWYAIAPSVLLLAAGEPDARLDRWPWLLAALGVQLGADLLLTTVREWAALDIAPRSLLRPLVWVLGVDALLAPVGLAIAISAEQWRGAVVFAVPLLLLIGIFAGEHRVRIDQAVELSSAYRGTALLLSGIIAADDDYTGAHSRDVVGLVAEVCDRLGLDDDSRRRAEFTALLHDVGKIRTPKSIINKPGPLTPEERALVERHTIEGQRLLEPVGGLLGDVALLIRSCHERYDGAGYPDGLAGEAIPLVSRIVCCCDAFHAMTSDRPYRRAAGVEAAVTELELHSGTQFDPAVVEQVVAIARERAAARNRPGPR